MVHTVGTAWGASEKRCCFIFAHPVIGNAVATINHFFVGCIENFKSRDHLACCKRFDLERAATELINTLSEIFEIFLKR